MDHADTDCFHDHKKFYWTALDGNMFKNWLNIIMLAVNILRPPPASTQSVAIDLEVRKETDIANLI